MADGGGHSDRVGDLPARSLLRRLVGPVYIPILGGTIARGILIPVFPLYLTSEGMSLELTGAVLGATGLGALLGGLPMGAAGARFGEDRMLLGALGAIALSTAALGLTATAVGLVVLRAVFGASVMGMRLSRQMWVTRRVAPSRRGRVLSLIGGSTRFSMLVGPVLGGWLADQFGFETAFVVAAVLTLIGGVPLLLGTGGSVAVLPEYDFPRQKTSLIGALRRHARFLLVAAATPFLIIAVREGRLVILPLMGDDLELSATTVGLLVAVGAAADLVLFPVSGVLMDRFGRLWGMVPAFSLISLGLVLLAAAWNAGSVGGLVGAGVVIGIGNGLSAGSLLTLGSDLAPADATGEFLAGLATLQEVGRIVGPILVGLVAAQLTLGSAALALAVVCMLAIAWLVLVIGETRESMKL